MNVLTTINGSYAFFLMQWAASSSLFFLNFYYFHLFKKEKAGLVSAKLIIIWCLASYKGGLSLIHLIYVNLWIGCLQDSNPRHFFFKKIYLMECAAAAANSIIHINVLCLILFSFFQSLIFASTAGSPWGSLITVVGRVSV